MGDPSGQCPAADRHWAGRDGDGGGGELDALLLPASAAPVTGPTADGTYLALRDSVAFGYVPGLKRCRRWTILTPAPSSATGGRGGDGSATRNSPTRPAASSMI